MTDFAILNGATIVFDLDGTLVESAPDVIGSVNRVLIAEGVVALPYDQGRPLISRGGRNVLAYGLAAAVVHDALARANASSADFSQITQLTSRTRADRFRAWLVLFSPSKPPAPSW